LPARTYCWQSHSTADVLAFYEGKHSLKNFKGELFAHFNMVAWNRFTVTGYKIVRIYSAEKGAATGEYEDFVTGFVADDTNVWVTSSSDHCGERRLSWYLHRRRFEQLWRVTYVGNKRSAKLIRGRRIQLPAGISEVGDSVDKQ